MNVTYLLSRAVPFLQLVRQLEPLGDSIGNKWILTCVYVRRETERDFISVSALLPLPFLLRTWGAALHEDVRSY